MKALAPAVDHPSWRTRSRSELRRPHAAARRAGTAAVALFAVVFLSLVRVGPALAATWPGSVQPPFSQLQKGCPSAGAVPARAQNTTPYTIIIDGQMQAGQESNYNQIGNAKVTLAYRTVAGPDPTYGTGTSAAASAWGLPGGGSYSLPSADPQVQYWAQHNDPFFYTAGSSDFIAAGFPSGYGTNNQEGSNPGPKMVPECAGDQALEMPSGLGLYFHEFLLSGVIPAADPWNYTMGANELVTGTQDGAAPTGGTTCDSPAWQTITDWVWLADQLNKKIVWSEPAQGWWYLLNNSCVDTLIAESGNTIVPMFATNFDADTAGYLMGVSREYAALTAQRYAGQGLQIGESVQSWYWRGEKLDLPAQVSTGLPQAGASGYSGYTGELPAGWTASNGYNGKIELDPDDWNSYTTSCSNSTGSLTNALFGDPFFSDCEGVAGEEPELAPTESGTVALANFGAVAGATYYQVEGANDSHWGATTWSDFGTADTYPRPPVHGTNSSGQKVTLFAGDPPASDMDWPDPYNNNGPSPYLKGIQDFAGDLLNGTQATQEPPTVALCQWWDAVTFSHDYTTDANDTCLNAVAPTDPGDASDPGGLEPGCSGPGASPQCDYAYNQPGGDQGVAGYVVPTSVGSSPPSGLEPLYEYRTGADTQYLSTKYLGSSATVAPPAGAPTGTASVTFNSETELGYISPTWQPGTQPLYVVWEPGTQTGGKQDYFYTSSAVWQRINALGAWMQYEDLGIVGYVFTYPTTGSGSPAVVGPPPQGPPDNKEALGDNPAEPHCQCDDGSDPIDSATGNLTETTSDIALPGRGVAIDLERTYNSLNASTPGPFGYGWTDSYNITLTTNGSPTASGTIATVNQEDGSTVQFELTSGQWSPVSVVNGTPEPATRIIATLSYNSTTEQWTYVRQHTDTFIFGTTAPCSGDSQTTSSDSYELTTLEDLNGYQTNLCYNNAGELYHVTDPEGRTITFSYTTSGGISVISSVSDSTGRQVSYGYDASGDLAQVTGLNTNPSTATDLNVTQYFDYDSAHHPQDMLSPNGGLTTNVFLTGGQLSSQTVCSYPESYKAGGTIPTCPTGQECPVAPVSGACPMPESEPSRTTTWTYGAASTLPSGATQIVTTITAPPTDGCSTGGVTTETYTNGDLTEDQVACGSTVLSTASDQYDPETNEATLVKAPNGGTTQYSYCDAAAGCPWTVGSYSGTSPFGSKLTQTDALGNTTTWTYNQFGEIATQTDPALYGASPVATSYYYDQSAYVGSPYTNAHATTPAGTGTRPPCQGNLTSVSTPIETPTGANNGTRTTVYYHTGYCEDVSKETDPDTNVWTYTYDQYGDKTSQTSPTVSDDEGGTAEQAVTLWQYNNIGQMTAMMAPRYYGNFQTTTPCGAPGDAFPTGTPSPSNQIIGCTVYSYSADGQLLATVDPLGYTTSSTYDGDGNVLSTTDGDGNTTSYQYDADNERVATTNPTSASSLDPNKDVSNTGGWTVQGGSGSNPMTSVLAKNVRQPNGLPSTSSDIYDDSADAKDAATLNVAPYTLSSGQTVTGATVWVYLNDPDCNVSLSLLASATTVYTHALTGCAASGDGWESITYTGSLTSTQLAALSLAITYTGTNASATYVYAAYVDVKTTSISYTSYYPGGDVQEQIDGDGDTTTYHYDGLGHVASVTTPPTATDTSGRTTYYQYDAQGDLLVKTNPSVGTPCTTTSTTAGCTIYTYDADDNLTAANYNDTTTPTPNVTYGYDADGRRVCMSSSTTNRCAPEGTTPSASGVSTWTYDSADDVLSATNAAGATIGYAYDDEGDPTKTTYPGGVGAVTRQYDGDGRVESISDWKGNTTDYDYDEDGDIELIDGPGGEDAYYYDAGDNIYNIFIDGSSASATFYYTRDGDNNVTQVQSTGVPSDNHSYSYNGMSELATIDSANYTYDPAKRIDTQPSGVSGTYDDAGEITKLTNSSGSSAFTYNADGDRTSGGIPGQPTGTYTYNQAGQLATATEGSGYTYTYAYDGDGLRISKTTSTKSETYTWDSVTGSVPLMLGDSTTQSGSTSTTDYIYGPGDLPLESINGSTIVFYHHDQQGSTRVLTNVSGAFLGTATYTPYGAVSATTGTTTPLGYDGQYTDPETGFIYLRARYYDPTTAEFLTVDPQTAASGEPYAYADDNPLSESDPSGERVLGTGWDKAGPPLSPVAALVVGGEFEKDAQSVSKLTEYLSALAGDWAPVIDGLGQLGAAEIYAAGKDLINAASDANSLNQSNNLNYWLGDAKTLDVYWVQLEFFTVLYIPAYPAAYPVLHSSTRPIKVLPRGVYQPVLC